MNKDNIKNAGTGYAGTVKIKAEKERLMATHPHIPWQFPPDQTG